MDKKTGKTIRYLLLVILFFLGFSGLTPSTTVDRTIIAWGGNWDGQGNVPEPNSGLIAVAAGSFHSPGIRIEKEDFLGTCFLL